MKMGDGTQAARFASGAAYIHGKFVPLAHAALSLRDYAVLRSDVTCDTIQVIEGAFFRLDDHLDRFDQGCMALKMKHGMDRPTIKNILAQIVALHGLTKCLVCILACRGKNMVPGSRDPRDCENHFSAYTVPYGSVFPKDVMERGGRIWIAKDVRRIPDFCIDLRVKNYHWGDLTAGILEAKERGYDSTFLLDINGDLAEGHGFNIFAVKGNQLITPERHCLHGITRKAVIEVANELGMATECRSLPLIELMEADEVFITSSAGGPAAVVQVDDRVFSNGAEGPVTKQVRFAYWEFVQRGENRTPIDYRSRQTLIDA